MNCPHGLPLQICLWINLSNWHIPIAIDGHSSDFQTLKFPCWPICFHILMISLFRFKFYPQLCRWNIAPNFKLETQHKLVKWILAYIFVRSSPRILSNSMHPRHRHVHCWQKKNISSELAIVFLPWPDELSCQKSLECCSHSGELLFP